MKYVFYSPCAGKTKNARGSFIGYKNGELDERRFYELSKCKTFNTKSEAQDAFNLLSKNHVDEFILKHFDIRIISFDEALLKEIIE